MSFLQAITELSGYSSDFTPNFLREECPGSRQGRIKTERRRRWKTATDPTTVALCATLAPPNSLPQSGNPSDATPSIDPSFAMSEPLDGIWKSRGLPEQTANALYEKVKAYVRKRYPVYLERGRFDHPTYNIHRPNPNKTDKDAVQLDEDVRDFIKQFLNASNVSPLCGLQSDNCLRRATSGQSQPNWGSTASLKSILPSIR